MNFGKPTVFLFLDAKSFLASLKLKGKGSDAFSVKVSLLKEGSSKVRASSMFEKSGAEKTFWGFSFGEES